MNEPHHIMVLIDPALFARCVVSRIKALEDDCDHFSSSFVAERMKVKALAKTLDRADWEDIDVETLISDVQEIIERVNVAETEMGIIARFLFPNTTDPTDLDVTAADIIEELQRRGINAGQLEHPPQSD